MNVWQPPELTRDDAATEAQLDDIAMIAAEAIRARGYPVTPRDYEDIRRAAMYQDALRVAFKEVLC